MSTPAIQVQDVTVHYGDVLALDRATATISAGRICGLVGMNGSGKSTLFKSIMGMVKPGSGTVTVNGGSPERARKSGIVGYVPQSEDVDWAFPISVRDVVDFLVDHFPREVLTLPTAPGAERTRTREGA